MKRILLVIAILFSAFVSMAKAEGVSPADLGYKKIDVRKDTELIEPGSTVWVFFSEWTAPHDEKEKKEDWVTTENGWIKFKVASTVLHTNEGVMFSVAMSNDKSDEWTFATNPENPNPNSLEIQYDSIWKDGSYHEYTGEVIFTEIWVK